MDKYFYSLEKILHNWEIKRFIIQSKMIVVIVVKIFEKQQLIFYLQILESFLCLTLDDVLQCKDVK